MDSAPRLTIPPVWYILFQTEQRRNELDLMMKMDKTYKTRDYGNIFRLIYAMKRCTRQQIAEKLSISLPTVTHNLNLLTQRGLVYNSGAHHATGGRKANLYQCVADSRLALGIDITRRHLSLVLINLELQIVDKKRIRCAFQDSDAYFAHMGRELTEILSKNGVDGGRLLGVGVSMPVIVNSDQKSISYAEVINVGENLYERMAAHIPYPFLLFNDANSAGLAESWVSDSSGDMTYLFLSASVGGAYMTGRQLQYGANQRTGEFGHMCIVPGGRRCYCGQRGCLDAYCSAKILSDFTGGNLGAFFEALKQGDNPGYRRLFDQYMDYLAIAVKNLRMCYDSDIVLGGTVGAYMSDYIDVFRQKVAALNPFERETGYIRVCHYKTEAAAVGSAIYYINEFIGTVENQ